MSLLNDMLRDLSHAHKTQNDAVPNAHSGTDMDSLSQSGMLKHEPRPLLPSVIAFITVLLVFFAWKFYNTSNANDAVPDNLAVTLANQQGKPTVEDAIPEETHANDVIESPQKSESKNKTAHSQNHTDKNLTDASISAGGKSTEALTERLAALETAINTLSVVMQKTQGADNELVEVEANETALLDEEFSNGNSVAESISVADPFDQGIQPAKVQVTGNTLQALPADDTLPEDAHLAIAPNAIFLDQHQADLGRSLYHQGESGQAISQLQSFIATEKSPRESTLALLDIFADQGHVIELSKVLNNAKYLTDIDRQFYAAKIAVIEQRENDAVELLEVYLAETDSHEYYRAFLAGLYQRTGKYEEATAAYRRLLTNFGEKPAYWLGFALAQDSLNQSQTARQAYLRLANYSGLQPEVQSYIQQRLASLQ